MSAGCLSWLCVCWLSELAVLFVCVCVKQTFRFILSFGPPAAQPASSLPCWVSAVFFLMSSRESDWLSIPTRSGEDEEHAHCRGFIALFRTEQK